MKSELYQIPFEPKKADQNLTKLLNPVPNWQKKYDKAQKEVLESIFN